MLLFAELPDWAPWLAATAGGAVVWLANWIVSRWDKKRANEKEDEKSIVDHQGKTIERLSRELDNVKARCDKQGAMIQRMLGHIGYLEGLMTAKGGMEFNRFNLGESGEHRPLATGD